MKAVCFFENKKNDKASFFTVYCFVFSALTKKKQLFEAQMSRINKADVDQVGGAARYGWLLRFKKFQGQMEKFIKSFASHH